MKQRNIRDVNELAHSHNRLIVQGGLTEQTQSCSFCAALIILRVQAPCFQFPPKPLSAWLVSFSDAHVGLGGFLCLKCHLQSL